MSIATPVEFPRAKPMQMTPKARRNIKTVTITVSVGALLTALLAGAPKAAALVRDLGDVRYALRTEFVAYQAAQALKNARDSAYDARVLDVLCEIKPNARACR